MLARLLPLLAMLAASVAHGAVTTTDSLTVQLKRGSSIVGTYEDQDQCEESKAERIAVEGLTRFSGSATYSCIETRRTVARFSAAPPPPPPACPPLSAPTSRAQMCPTPTVGTWQQDLSYTSPYPTCSTAWLPEAPPDGMCAVPPPVDCATSAWGEWTGGAWSTCVAGTQSRQETRARTVTTQPSNGGAACPTLIETRTATQSCAVEPPAGSVTNLPVVCTASNVTEGAAISACAWNSQRFEPASASSLVRSCSTTSCTTTTATWRRLGNVGAGTVEVCTLPKLPGDPIVGGHCSATPGSWDAMAYVPAGQVAAAAPSNATVSWTTPPQQDPITGYLIVWGASADQLTNSVSVAASARSYTFDLPPGSYHVAVIVLAGGHRVQSNVVRITVPSEQTLALTWPSSGSELFRDDFRSGDRSHKQNGVEWVGSHNTSVVPYGSGYALQFHYSNPASGSSFAEQRFRLGQLLTELWVKVDLVIPANFQHPDGDGADNNKFFRLWSGTYQQYGIKNGFSLVPDRNGTGESELIFEFGKTKSDGSLSGVGQFGSYRVPVRRFINADDYGKTISIVMQFVVDTAGPVGTAQPSYLGGNGVQRVWKNGVLVAELTTISNNAGPGKNGWTDGYFWGADNSDYHGGTESTIFLARDVVFSRTNIFGVRP